MPALANSDAMTDMAGHLDAHHLDSNALDGTRTAQVRSLARAAERADGVRPLSEQTLLDLELPTATRHLLALADDQTIGYARITPQPGRPPAAEVVVDPAYRRAGVGSELLRAVLDRGAGVWARGNLPAAAGLAERNGLVVVRDLWQMARPMNQDSADEIPHPVLPQGFSTRTFQVGQDEEEWLAVNARAFAHHPEQGRTTIEDLHERIAEPWFDAGGFFLVHDECGEHPRLAAFHWTKIEQPQDASLHDASLDDAPLHDAASLHDAADEGEVYVVGVDPGYQGHGLGRAVTLLGLAHLQAAGVRTATLYVEADNAAAVATYSRLGFAQTGSDVVYAARPRFAEPADRPQPAHTQASHRNPA